MDNNTKIEHKNVVNVNIEKEMKDSYMDYAMSVIVGRALPDSRDGLKPVHRRTLYTMYEMGNYWNRSYKKSARVVGDVMGKYHPHGDTPIYDTIVRLAQDFNMRHVLVDGQGNFGSIDGDRAAAMRYTEVRMAKITNELLLDIDKDTVGFIPNYDGSTKEPVVLPSRIPNLLVNGSSGIAVGMSTNIPPHNLSEILDAVIALTKNPELSIDDLINIIPGPDFPTAGVILGRENIHSAYRTGRGIIRIQGKTAIEENKGKQKIVITEVPYQVNKARLIEKIAYLYKEKKIEGIRGIRDESDKKGIRIVIDVSSGENPEVIINGLHKLTQLTDSFGIIMLALHNGQPKILNIKEFINIFIDHRKEIIIRRTVFNLRKSEAREHILQGLLKAISNIDPIIALIKKSKNTREAKQGLQNKFDFSDIQAQAILDMRLHRLTGLELDNLKKELKELEEKIKYYKEILSSEELVRKLIIEESEEIKKKYGEGRKTEITSAATEINEDEFFQEEQMIVSITNRGYIKRNPLKEYSIQKRGGKGIKGVVTDEEDFTTHLFSAYTRSNILFFTNLGKIHLLKVYKIPKVGRSAKGKAIVNLLNLSKVEKICSVIPIKDLTKNGSIVMVTEKGTIKRTKLEEFLKGSTSGIKAIKIKPDDTLVKAAYVADDADLFLSTKGGMGIRFSVASVRAIGRAAAGVKGINLSNDNVAGMAIIPKESDKLDLLLVSSKGIGKRTLVKEFRPQSRGGKGMIALKLSADSALVASHVVSENDDLMLIGDKGKIIRTSVREISQVGRYAKGVRLISLTGDEKLVAVQPVASEEEIEEE